MMPRRRQNGLSTLLTAPGRRANEEPRRVSTANKFALYPLSTLWTVVPVRRNLCQARTASVLPAVTACPNEFGAIHNRWRCYRW
jgi:hypothetical protein